MASPIIASLADHTHAVIVTFRGVITSGDPFDTPVGGVKAATSTAATLPALTTTVAESLVVLGITKDSDSAAAWVTSMTNANLTSLTERYDAGTALGLGGGIGVYTGIKATAGSTDTTVATIVTAINAYQVFALKPAVPVVAQSAFRLYEDGTESGSTVIAAQNTNITRTVDTDSNLALRVRLQESGAVAGASTDDYQLQYSLDGGAYANVGTVESPVIADTFALANRVGNQSGSGSTQDMVGQSFLGDGKYIASASIGIARNGTATGSISAKLYSHSGTYGSGGVPVTLLATSNSLDASTQSSTNTLVEFIFSSVQMYKTTAASAYFIVLDRSGLTNTNNITVTFGAGHGGNRAIRNAGTWTADTNDVCFSVATISTVTGVEVVPYASPSLTDGGATTNRLGAGTGSFVAGEVSETGLVTDHQLTASNYTEHLYSLTVVSSAVADTDTLDFRVLRNGAVLNSYAVTPRITVSKSGGAPANTTDFFQFF
jgi:hypothetical protein